MGLFQTSVLKKYRKLQDTKAVDKAFKKYVEYFQNPERQRNILEIKEEGFQQKFLMELFVNVFDYVINPDPGYNLTTEYKNEKGNKKADGAILASGHDPLTKKALAVIELKSTKTKDLESIRQQAFDYKANQSACVYVITSNFEKLRFYINNAVEFEEFNLFTLNAGKFELLYLCLHKDNILQNLPLKIKTDSVVAEENITKKFYADYSLFKRELFRDLIMQNTKNEVFRAELQKDDKDRTTKNIKQALFKKSQKLIDRFLFIFFAEDKGLLPPNSTLKILKDWDKLNELDTNIPLYDRFKLYFKYLDEGRKGTDKKAEIFAYNGGLFKPDAILDSLTINDRLLYKHTKTLSDYDFESQVGVNILGHIFENSLNEIESVNAEIEGTEFDAQKTKRKKDGVFYTPKYITKYIVDNTIGKLCEGKKEELGIEEGEYQKSRKGRKTETLKKLKTKLDTYRDWLLTLTILDPACGSGAFLNQALDFLIKEHTYIDELETSLLGGGMVLKNIENTILEKNIYGVDLNEESVEIAKLSLWLRTAQPRRKLNTLNNNIKCGNSLIDDPKIAGNKAFNWQEEFPLIFQKKEKKVWHITTATHNSRYSQRMFDNHVKRGEAIWLDSEDEILVTKTIARIVKEDKLNVIEYNICGDHMHILLVCDKNGMEKIVGKLKAVSSRKYNIEKGITIPSAATRGHVPLSGTDAGTDTATRATTDAATRGENDAAAGGETDSGIAAAAAETNTEGKKEKKKYNSLWTQKFGKSEIRDESYLNNAIAYIRNNRIKHELPKSKEIEKIKKEFICSKEHALRTEYKGGFDVVIGNPPYVDIKGLDESVVKYIFNYFSSANNRVNLYSTFIEKTISLIKQTGKFSFIIPSSLLTSESYRELRRLILNKTTINNIVRLPNESFGGSAGEVKVDTIILTFEKGLIPNTEADIIIYKGFERISEIETYNANIYFRFNTLKWRDDPENVFRINVTSDVLSIIEKCEKETKPLIDCSEFCLGLTPYDKYQGHSQEQIRNRVFHAPSQKDDTFRKLLAGNDIKRYLVSWGGEEWISYGEWLGAPREKRFFTDERILVKQIIDWSDKRIWAALTDAELYNTQNAFNIIPKENYSSEFLIAIINSKLMSFFHRKKFLEEYKDRFQKILIREAKEFPIKQITINEQAIFKLKVQEIITKTNNLNNRISLFTMYLLSQFKFNPNNSQTLNMWIVNYPDDQEKLVF